MCNKVTIKEFCGEASSTEWYADIYINYGIICVIRNVDYNWIIKM